MTLSSNAKVRGAAPRITCVDAYRDHATGLFGGMRYAHCFAYRGVGALLLMSGVFGRVAI